VQIDNWRGRIAIQFCWLYLYSVVASDLTTARGTSVFLSSRLLTWINKPLLFGSFRSEAYVTSPGSLQ
jgi:hypothetical protein